MSTAGCASANNNTLQQQKAPVAKTEFYECKDKLENDKQSLIFNAMGEEFKRNNEKLRIEGYKEPYYMSFAGLQRKTFEYNARGGTVRKENKEAFLFKSEVRIGDYSNNATAFTPAGTLEAKPYNIKRALWLASDDAIKNAEMIYYARKARNITKIKKKKQLADFSRENPSVCMGKNVKLVEKENLEDILREVSKKLGNHENILKSGINVGGEKRTKYFMNSEGTRIVQSSVYYQVQVWAQMLTEEGESFQTFKSFLYRKPEELPNKKELKELTIEIINELNAVKEAPKLGPTSVPAIFDSDNTGVFWHEVIGHRLEGERQIRKFSGKTLKNKFNKKITSELVTLVDDPTLAYFKGKSLNGHYLYDDEGVQAQRVKLIDKGTLKNYLMSRKPIDGFDKSNGHGRTNFRDDPIARMGNTMLIPENTVPLEKLKELAKKEAIEQGKDFYLIFKGSLGGLTATSAFSSFQAFKTIPRKVYKVDVDTGEKTLVRPVEVIGTPLNVLNNIVAFGNDSKAWNGMCGAESGWVPVSVIAPSMLVEEVEVQNNSKNIWKAIFESEPTPPILPPPKR